MKRNRLPILPDNGISPWADDPTNEYFEITDVGNSRFIEDWFLMNPIGYDPLTGFEVWFGDGIEVSCELFIPSVDDAKLPF